MTFDRTQLQSTQQQQESVELSLDASKAPAAIPGYVLQSRVGRGAFGEVWAAIDRKTGRRVAIKFYNRRRSIDISLLGREVEKLVYLAADRYVVQLLDVGWDADPPYYVMDYIENGSLEDRLKRGEPLPTSDAIEIFEELVIGLMHLHAKGILHCDIKPGNVLLDRDLKPRLADFGQSRLSHEQAPALGTLFYMAPEQADLNAVPDARWDVYSLGALFYAMVTGEAPYRTTELADQIESATDTEERLARYRQAILTSPRPTAHRRRRGIDRHLADIIDRSIAANPKQRFASAESVLQALRQRKLAHAQRPLVILGIVGPLLLLATMSLFGWHALRRAVDQSDQAITRKASESNGWAAQLAARSAAEQINDYLRAVRQVVADPAFQNAFVELIEDEGVARLRDELNHPRGNDDPALDDVRRQFITSAARQPLQRYLEGVIGRADFPIAASWIVTDAAGTQLAASFLHPDPAGTIGRNYAYRSYFSGQPRDLVTTGPRSPTSFEVADDPAERHHLGGPFLSSIFLSRATNTWKFAISAPIQLEGRFAGIVGVTIEVGHFIEFEGRTDDDGKKMQYAMLVDGRPASHGIILEHPMYDAILARQSRLPMSVNEQRLELDQITDEPGHFRDPLSQLGEPESVDYAGRWLAAKAPVRWAPHGNLADSERQLEDTGMWVVTVEDHETVVRPAHQLGQQLVRIGAGAIAVFLLVSGALVALVANWSRSARRSVMRSTIPATDSQSGLQNIDTILAPDDRVHHGPTTPKDT